MEVFSGTGTEETVEPEADWIGRARGSVADDLVLCEGRSALRTSCGIGTALTFWS